MHRLFFLLLVASVPCSMAADEPMPNRLSGDEIAQGWILLYDGSSTFGWYSPDGSEWKGADGALTAPGDKNGMLVTTTAFLDYDLSLECRDQADSNSRLLIGCDAQGKPAPGERSLSTRASPGPTRWSKVLVKVRGGEVKTAQSGGRIQVDCPEQSCDLAHSHLALAGKGFAVRNVRLRPQNMEKLFNGRDLAGWKEYPGKKSKFSVSAEGLLNVRNGPGDLQTEKGWADFILQLECYSNGSHLNSGIFFRCQPGKYQQGYEAQIRNQFTREAVQEYSIEEYDPDSHRLTGKKKVRSAAVDYGTGAIYRRMPARREVSRDREWLTLTIIAEGRHLSTWVNGIQQVDWTDERPTSDNARNGCRLEAGPISIQGHDPTTDLSFRNFRIAELKKPAARDSRPR